MRVMLCAEMSDFECERHGAHCDVTGKIETAVLGSGSCDADNAWTRKPPSGVPKGSVDGIS